MAAISNMRVSYGLIILLEINKFFETFLLILPSINFSDCWSKRTLYRSKSFLPIYSNRNCYVFLKRPGVKQKFAIKIVPLFWQNNSRIHGENHTSSRSFHKFSKFQFKYLKSNKSITWIFCFYFLSEKRKFCKWFFILQTFSLLHSETH